MTTTMTKVTRVQFETLRVEADIDLTKAGLEAKTSWLKRMVVELTYAVDFGQDHACQVTNLMTAVADVAHCAEKLTGLKATLHILGEIQAC